MDRVQDVGRITAIFQGPHRHPGLLLRLRIRRQVHDRVLLDAVQGEEPQDGF